MRWEEYIKELFYDTRSDTDDSNTNKMTEELLITPQELEFALLKL